MNLASPVSGSLSRPKDRVAIEYHIARLAPWQDRSEDLFGAGRRWRDEIFRAFPPALAHRLSRRFADHYRRYGRHHAALELAQSREKCAELHFTRASSEEEIRGLARQCARRCWELSSGVPETQALTWIAPLLERHDLAWPTAKTAGGTLARLRCARWWRRNLRRQIVRTHETAALRLNLVNRRNGIYVSDRALDMRRAQCGENRSLLKALAAINETGDEYPLEDLWARAPSNPQVRRPELMCRIAGFEDVATECGDVGLFITITCPARMHASLSRTGTRNPRYDNTTPRRAQAYLRRQWARARSALHRREIQPYGFRIAEPQHDGTPHWHLLLFIDPAKRDDLLAVLRHYAMQIDPGESGAEAHRFAWTEIDWSRGSAAGYVAKYISKNIDGYGIERDRYGPPAKKSAERVEAWASTWGIRQFQQIGGPPVTVWRELRRLREPVADPRIEACRAAADEGDWARYVQGQGGPTAPRSRQPVGLAKLWCDAPGEYGDPKGYVTFGVQCGIISIQTRLHTWEIKLIDPNRDAGRLIMGEADVLDEGGGAPAGRSPAGAAPPSARPPGDPMSSGPYRGFGPLEFCQ